MFKKLKEKLTEEVKSSPQRFAEFTQTVSDKLQNNSTPDDSFFSIGDGDDSNNTATTIDDFSDVALVSPLPDSRTRKISNASISSDISFLPRFESVNTYQLQSDLDISASEIEDNVSTASSQLGHLSKEQIHSAFQKSQMRYHKYRGRYTDLARHYKDLNRELTKMKSVLVETQDKAIRRVTELKEQCNLEQKAKAHLESALRDDIDERNCKIQTLQTKIDLLMSESKANSRVNLEDTQAENLENLTKYLNDARKEIESLNEKIQEQKAYSIVSQTKEQEYKQKIASLDKEIAVFSEREKENNLKLAENKMELHNELISKDSEITALKRDNELQKQNLAALEAESKNSGNTKLENLQVQNKKLIEKLESLTQRSNYLDKELLKLESYKIEIENLKVEQRKSVDETVELRELNSLLVTEKDNMKSELKLLNDEIHKLSTENTKQQENFTAEKGSLEKQILELREDAKKGLLSLEPKIREKLQTQFSAREEELRRDFFSKIEELSFSNNDLKEIKLQLLLKEDIIKNISEELDIARNDLSKKQSEYISLEKNHLELIEDCTKLRNTIFNLEKDKMSAESYEEKILRLEDHIQTLQQELTEFKNISGEKRAEKSEKEAEIISLKESLQDCQSDYEHLMQMLNEENAKNVNFEKEILNREVAIENLKETVSISEKKVEALENEKKELLESLESERNNFVRELIILKQKLSAEFETEPTHAEDNNTVEDFKDVINDIKLFSKNKRKEIVGLSKEIAKLHQEVTEKSEKMRLLEEHLKTSECEICESKLLALKLEEENCKLISDCEMGRKMISEKENLIDQLESKLKNMQIEIYEISDSLTQQTAESFRLHNEKVNLDNTVSKMKDTIRIFEERDEAMEIERSERDRLEEKIHHLEKEKRNFLGTFEKERAGFDIMHKQTVKNEREIELLLNENLLIKNSISEIKEKIKHFKALMKDNRQQYVNAQKALIDSNNNLKKDLGAKNVHIGELSEKIVNLNNIIEQRANEFNDVLERTKQLDAMLEKAQDENARLIERERKQQNDFISEIDNMKTEMSEKSEKCFEISEKLSRTEKMLTEEKLNCSVELEKVRSLQNRIEHLEDGYRNQSEDRNSLDGKLKQAETILRDKHTQVELLTQENKNLTEERDNLLSDVLSLQSEISNLNVEINNLRMVSSQVSDSDRKTHVLQSENQILKEEVEAANKEISELNTRIKQLAIDNQNLIEESQATLNETEEFRLKLEHLENERLNHNKARCILEEENLSLKETIGEIRSKSGEVEEANLELLNTTSGGADITQTQRDYQDLKEKCENCLAENNTLKSDCSTLVDKLNDLGRVKLTLETQVSELEKQYTEIMHEKQLLQDEVQELKISPLNYSNTVSKLEHLNHKNDHAPSIDNEKESYQRVVEDLRDRLMKYKSLDITNKSSIEFYESELEKLKKQNDKLTRRLDETLVTLNHCTELSTTSTEVEYLKNVLYNYMLGKESIILARVIAAVCKFDPEQTEVVLQREQQKQSLLGQLGFI